MSATPLGFKNYAIYPSLCFDLMGAMNPVARITPERREVGAGAVCQLLALGVVVLLGVACAPSAPRDIVVRFETTPRPAVVLPTPTPIRSVVRRPTRLPTTVANEQTSRTSAADPNVDQLGVVGPAPTSSTAGPPVDSPSGATAPAHTSPTAASASLSDPPTAARTASPLAIETVRIESTAVSRAIATTDASPAPDGQSTDAAAVAVGAPTVPTPSLAPALTPVSTVTPLPTTTPASTVIAGEVPESQGLFVTSRRHGSRDYYSREDTGWHRIHPTNRVWFVSADDLLRAFPDRVLHAVRTLMATRTPTPSTGGF